MTSKSSQVKHQTNYNPESVLLKSCNVETRFRMMKKSGRSMTLKEH